MSTSGSRAEEVPQGRGVTTNTLLLVLATASVTIGALIAAFVLFVAPASNLSAAGYLLSSLVAFSLIAVQRRTAAHHQAKSGHIEPRWMRVLAGSVIAVGFVATGVNAFMLAWAHS